MLTNLSVFATPIWNEAMAREANRRTGAYGEQLARRYLEQRGYTIIATNWRCAYGEIDIIAQDGTGLIFVEVRTRHSGTTEAAFASITPQKRERLIKAAQSYLSASEHDDVDWRIDMIAIALRRGEPPIIQYQENALDW